MDPENLIKESVKSNNVASSVWGATLEPDLSINSTDITFSPPVVKNPPSDVSINATVWNLGKTDVPQAIVALYKDEISLTNKIGEQSSGISSAIRNISDPLCDDPGCRRPYLLYRY